jgi:hypothetical protein
VRPLHTLGAISPAYARSGIFIKKLGRRATLQRRCCGERVSFWGLGERRLSSVIVIVIVGGGGVVRLPSRGRECIPDFANGLRIENLEITEEDGTSPWLIMRKGGGGAS